MKPARPLVTAAILAVGAGALVAAFSALDSKPAIARRNPPRDTPPPPPPVQNRPRVEVVFVLDTTSSMSGLIDGAKRKIWSIADYIAKAQPQPELRIGLVAYRDKGDAYVTQVTDLSSDLDAVFLRLRELRAEGGGDTPEHVGKGLHDALDKVSWSKDGNVMKTIYLVGDAPPQEYHDGFSAPAAAKKAHERGIALNTIRCGDMGDTQRTFRALAQLGGGDFSSIGQDGAVAAVKTPYDEKLAALSDKLAGTAIGYGSEAAQRDNLAKVRNAYALPAEAKADRAAFVARKGRATDGEDDVVAAYAEGRLDVAAAPAASLGGGLGAMAPAARAEVVAKKAEERKAILKEIDSLAQQRAKFVATENAKSKTSFDAKVREGLKKQAKDHGLAME